MSRVTCNCHGAHDAGAEEPVSKHRLQLVSVEMSHFHTVRALASAGERCSDKERTLCKLFGKRWRAMAEFARGAIAERCAKGLKPKFNYIKERVRCTIAET